MPINIGDAVLTFMGDTTQLDLAFDKVSGDAETKLGPAAAAAEGIGEGMKKSGADSQVAGTQMSTAWDRVAQATARNQQAQTALKAALDGLKKSGGEDVVVMLQLAQAQQNAARASQELAIASKEATASIEEESVSMKEATGTIALGGDLVGVQMPRHLRTFIATLPGVGAALEAAFAFTAVLVLIDILAKGIEKLIEWSEAGEKLHEGWVKLDATFQDTSTHIQEEIEKQEEKFVQLTEGPVAALDFAMKHLRSTAVDTLKSISTELDATSQQFKDASPWYEFGVGFIKASKELKQFDTKLTETMRKAIAENPGDTMAGYRAGLNATKTELDGVQKKYDALLDSLNRKGTSDLFDQNQMLAWQKQIEALTAAYKQLQQGVQLDTDREKAEAEAKVRAQQQVEVAQINAKKQTALAEIALEDEKNSILFERGQISFDQEQAALRKHENTKFNIERKALEDQKALTPDPSQQAALQGQVETLEKTHAANLLKIDQDTYKGRADQHTKFVEALITATRQGSQERVDLEAGLLNYYAMIWGIESDTYKQQLAKLNEAKRQQVEAARRIADEERKGEESLAADKRSFTEKYYAYLVQTSRETAATLLQIQQKVAEDEYQRKKAALEKEIATLDSQELEARKRLNSALALLNQQHQEQVQLGQLQTQDILETSYKQLGLKSGEMFTREVNLAQTAYDAIKKSGTSTYADILRAQEKLLQVQIGQALANGDQAKLKAYTAQLALLQQEMEKLGIVAKKTATSMVGWLDQFANKLKDTRGELHGFQATMDTVIGDASNVFGSAVTQWIQGQKSLGEALREGLAAELATIAGKAAAWSLYFLAWGIADSFWNPARAGGDFAAAAEFAALAGIAGAASYAIAPHNKQNSGSSPSASNSVGGSQQAPPQPVQSVNVQHFAEGGLVSGPTLAMIGDKVGSPSGQSEAALPLDHPEALRKVAEALGPYLAGSGGGDIHVHVKGLVSGDNLTKIIKNINTKVKKNQAFLTSSNSLRITKRSV